MLLSNFDSTSKQVKTLYSSVLNVGIFLSISICRRFYTFIFLLGSAKQAQFSIKKKGIRTLQKALLKSAGGC